MTFGTVRSSSGPTTLVIVHLSDRLQFLNGLLALAVAALGPIFFGGLPDIGPIWRGAYWLAIAAILGAFVVIAGASVPLSRGWTIRVGLVQVIATYLAYALGSTYGFGILLLAFTTSFWAYLVPLRTSVATVLVGLPLSTALSITLTHPRDVREILLNLCMAVLIQTFSLVAATQVQLTDRARADAERARTEAERAWSQLHAAQAELARRSATDERLRIARELHDSVGHQLTGLALTLENARHVAPERRASLMARAHASSKDLLQQVRRTVSDLREPDDAAATLPAVVSEHLGIVVHIDDPHALDGLSPHIRHAAARMVQEALTNARRHGGAENAWISIELDAESVTVAVRDDGGGAPSGVEGNGLRGMRERFGLLGGSVLWRDVPSGGFLVQASAPISPQALVP